MHNDQNAPTASIMTATSRMVGKSADSRVTPVDPMVSDELIASVNEHHQAFASEETHTVPIVAGATVPSSAEETFILDSANYATIALPGDDPEVLEEDYISENRIAAVFGAWKLLGRDHDLEIDRTPIVELLAKELVAYRTALEAENRERKWERFLHVYGIPVRFANDLIGDCNAFADPLQSLHR